MRSAIAVALAVVGSAFAQPYEFDIPLPDSLGGLGSPSTAVYAPAVGRVYVGGGRGGILVLDGATGLKLTRIPSVYGGAMHYDPINNRLFAGNVVVTAVNCSTNAILDTIRLGSQYRERRSALNPVTNKLYCIGRADTLPIVVVDCAGDSILHTIPVSGRPWEVAVSTVSNKVYVAEYRSGSRAIVLDGDADTIRGYIPGAYGNMCYNPLMNRLYITENYGTMSVVDCSTDQVIDTISLHGSHPMAWCSAGNKVYIAISGRDTAYVVNCSTNAIVNRLPIPADSRFLTYDSLRNTMYVSCYDAGKVAMVDCTSDSVVTVAAVPLHPGQGCSSQQGGRVFLPSDNANAVTAFDAETHDIVATIPTGEKIGRAFYAGREGKLYCFETDSARLAVCDTGKRDVTKRLAVGPYYRYIAYDRRVQELLLGGDSGLAVLSTQLDSVLVAYRDWKVTGICMDPTGGRIFVTTSDSFIRVLDVATNMFVDSTYLTRAGGPCYDPLTNRLWCQAYQSVAVFECDSGLRRVGTTAGLAGPTWNPWDGFIYGRDTLGFWGYDPISLNKSAGRTFSAPFPPGLTFDAAGDRLYSWQGNGHDGQGVVMYDCRSSSFDYGAFVGYPTYIDFVAAGRRVWAMAAYDSPWVQGENCEYESRCDAVGVTTPPLTCDAVEGRTFVPDVFGSRVVVFKDTVSDSMDVACTRVVGPVLRPDTGDAVVFRTALVNCGSVEKTCDVKLQVTITDNLGLGRFAGSFEDSASLFLDGCGWSAVAFDTWHPTVQGLYRVEAIASWPDDVDHSNDTARCMFRVSAPVIDVSPRKIDAPVGTVDSGTAVVPAVRILNLGEVTVSCLVRMTIGSQYADTQVISSIAPGDTQQVLFAEWTATELGVLAVRCSTMLDNDSNPKNNRLPGIVTVQRPGGVEEAVSIPATYFVADWTPNPFRSAASLSYGLPAEADVRLSIYSVDGRRMRELVRGVRPAGYHRAVWDGCDDGGRRCPRGVYFCRADVGPLRKSHKLTVTY